MIFAEDSFGINDFLVDQTRLVLDFEHLFFEIVNFIFELFLFSQILEFKVPFFLDGFKRNFLLLKFFDLFFEFFELIFLFHEVSGVVDIFELRFKGKYFIFELEDLKFLFLDFLLLFFEDRLILLKAFILSLLGLFFSLFIFRNELVEFI
jgi:hypothetical protein